MSLLPSNLKNMEDILEISSMLLKSTRIEVDDDLRLYGADSLMVAILIQLLNERGIDIDLSNLGNRITVRDLCIASKKENRSNCERNEESFSAGSNIYGALRQAYPLGNYKELYRWNLIGAVKFDFYVDPKEVSRYLSKIDIDIEHIYIEGLNDKKGHNIRLSSIPIQHSFLENLAEFFDKSEEMLNAPTLDDPIAIGVFNIDDVSYAVLSAHHFYADDLALNTLGRSLSEYLINGKVITLGNSQGHPHSKTHSSDIDPGKLNLGLMTAFPKSRKGYSRTQRSFTRNEIIAFLEVSSSIDDEALITYMVLSAIYGRSDSIVFERQHSGRNQKTDRYANVFASLTDVHPCVVSTSSERDLIKTLDYSKKNFTNYYNSSVNLEGQIDSIISRFLPVELHLNIRHRLDSILPKGSHIFDYDLDLLSEDHYSENLSPVFKYDVSVLIDNGLYHVSSYSKFNDWLDFSLREDRHFP